MIRRENRCRGPESAKFPVNFPVSREFELETGSIRAASTTTQSCATGDFLKVYERPRIGGDLCDGSFSETTSLQSAGRFCAFFSGPEIPFPGNGDRKRQRLGSNAGYAEGSPSMWCCRHAVTLELLIERTTSVAVRFNRRPAWLPAL